jgi:hypothetical protein
MEPVSKICESNSKVCFILFVFDPALMASLHLIK